MPLNWDDFTEMVLSFLNAYFFQEFFGTLDASGRAKALINSPALPPYLIGVKMHYAFCLMGPYDLASNPVEVKIIP